MQNPKSMYPIKDVSKIGEELSACPIISEFNESVDLVAVKVMSLFFNRPLFYILKKSMKVELKTDYTKKKIIYNCMTLSYTKVIKILEEVEEEEMKKIGNEFFYLTARKFAKNQSIANFALFLNIMFRNYGFDSQFVKKFLSNERDYSECLALLAYMKRWNPDDFKEPLNIIIFKTLMICLNRFSSNSDFFAFLNEAPKFFVGIDEELIQKKLQNLLLNFLTSIFSKNLGFELFKSSLNIFKDLALKFNQTIAIKIFETINRHIQEEGYLLIMMDFLSSNNIPRNIVIINTILDFYCMNGDFEKSLQIFNEIKQNNLDPDNFTYSIMIKGIKKMKNPNLELAESFFKTYIREFDQNNIVIYNSILDVFISFEQIEKANEIFEMIKNTKDLEADQITFNILIKGCCKIKNFEEADRYFLEMKSMNLKPNRITYNSLMDLAVKMQNMQRAIFYVQEMQKDDISADGFTYSIILNGLKINDSNIVLVSTSLEKIKMVIQMNQFRLDEIFFNSILDVCAKYNLVKYMDCFYQIMQDNKIRESPITFGILIKAYGKSLQFDKAFNIFEKMIKSNMRINDVTYGCILDACAKSGNMNIAMKIYNSLKISEVNLNSIVFTTIIKGFIRVEAYEEALNFFNEVKSYKELSGMIITYNCALDVLVRKKDIDSALKLFDAIEEIFTADLISYSTIIKGLCQSNQLTKALDYVKLMINSKNEIDVSVINLFLDSCSNKEDFKLGIQGYQYSMMKNIPPNEITFGIMIKIFGFSRELHKAFDLLDLMEVYNIKPSIIVYTNLIHISFYNRNAKKAELAFTLMRKQKIIGDKLMYSKIIDGLIRFKQVSKVPKYIDYALKDKCAMKSTTIEEILKHFKEPEIAEKLKLISRNETTEVKIEKKDRNLKFKNKFNEENPKKFKKIINEKKEEEDEKWTNQNQNKVLSSRQFIKKEPAKNENPNASYKNFQKPQMKLFNFRKNKNNE